MHACPRIGETQMFMSDGMCGGAPSFQGFTLAVSLKDDARNGRGYGLAAANAACSRRDTSAAIDTGVAAKTMTRPLMRGMPV